MLANRTPTDPRTLARAARDHVAAAPAFAVEAGLVALDWIAQGYGYELTSADVWAAYAPAKEAADRLGTGAEFRARVRAIIAFYTRGETRLSARSLGERPGHSPTPEIDYHGRDPNRRSPPCRTASSLSPPPCCRAYGGCGGWCAGT